MAKSQNMVVQRADEGNAAVLDKCSYICVIEQILNDNANFSKHDIPTRRKTNYIINLAKRIISELKLLKHEEIIDKAVYKSMKAVGSRPGIFYGFGKIH